MGAGAGAIAALQSGQIDAIANLDPVMTKLERTGEIRVVSDTRTLADTRSVFGGDMPAGCLYASQSFITKNPNTTQALTNAMVRALKWLQTATGSELINTVPEGYLLGDRAVYLDAWQHVQGSDVAGRPDARRWPGDVAEDPAGVRSERAGQADRSVEDVDQRLRQESADDGQGLSAVSYGASGTCRFASTTAVMTTDKPKPIFEASRTMTVAALALDNITCTFAARDNRAQRYTAVKDTTLRIAPGEFVSVVGPTGCGKSTLLNVGAGLLAAIVGHGQRVRRAAQGHQPARRLHVPGRCADAVALGASTT